jgi:hypothetical protein
MNANYATKVSLAIPFVSALVGIVTAVGAHAGILLCIISALGGFVVGFCLGALSVGLSGLFLTRPDRGGSSLVLIGSLAGYLVVPPFFLVASCVATVIGLRWIL